MSTDPDAAVLDSMRAGGLTFADLAALADDVPRCRWCHRQTRHEVACTACRWLRALDALPGARRLLAARREAR
jgi:hypothetical protein